MPRLTRNGHALFYVEEGAGGPPVLLIHGWCCDHTYLEPQLRHFAPSHRVVALDLLGHGRSDKPKQPYTMAGFADDVAWMCGQLRLDKPVVVGHSMGGIVSLELAARHPALPGAVVVLDSVTIPTPEGRARIERLLTEYRSPDYLEAVKTSLPGFFSPYDDPVLNARIMAEMSTVPQHVLAGAWAGLCEWDGAAALSACKVPFLYVAASAPRADITRLKELCPHMHTSQVVGAGHFLQLDVPEQLNPMLDRFMAILGSSNGNK